MQDQDDLPDRQHADRSRADTAHEHAQVEDGHEDTEPVSESNVDGDDECGDDAQDCDSKDVSGGHEVSALGEAAVDAAIDVAAHP